MELAAAVWTWGVGVIEFTRLFYKRKEGGATWV
jgi:hypothetical protein